MAYRDQPLGELALSIPRASALFRKYDMDYCCGGKQTLARAAARKELDVDVIEAELAKLAEQPIEKDWRSAPLAEIIDHIIVRYHDRHREQHRGDRQDHIHQPHDDIVDPAAIVTRDHPDRHSDTHSQQDGADPDKQRIFRAPQDAEE